MELFCFLFVLVCYMGIGLVIVVYVVVIMVLSVVFVKLMFKVLGLIEFWLVFKMFELLLQFVDYFKVQQFIIIMVLVLLLLVFVELIIMLDLVIYDFVVWVMLVMDGFVVIGMFIVVGLVFVLVQLQVQCFGVVCLMMFCFDLLVFNWSGEVVFYVLVMVCGGWVVVSEICVVQGVVDLKICCVLQYLVEVVLVGYQCVGDVMFEQDFVFWFD